MPLGRHPGARRTMHDPWTPNEPRVRLERDGNVAVVTLDDPARRNALSLEVTMQLGPGGRRGRRRSRRSGRWCSPPLPRPSAPADRSTTSSNPRASLRDMYAGLLALTRTTIPSVAAVNGPVIGAGVNLPARVRRDPGLAEGALRPAVHGSRHPPRRWPPLADGTAGRTAGRGRARALRRVAHRRGGGAGRPGVALRRRRRAARHRGRAGPAGGRPATRAGGVGPRRCSTPRLARRHLGGGVRAGVHRTRTGRWTSPRSRNASRSCGPSSRSPDRRTRSAASSSSSTVDDVELDPVDERVVGDRPRVGGASPQRLTVGLAAPPDVGRGDGGERHELDVVDLDLARPDAVPTADLHLGACPEPERERDRRRRTLGSRSSGLNCTDPTVRRPSARARCRDLEGPGLDAVATATFTLGRLQSR